jgi:hypothetical protein
MHLLKLGDGDGEDALALLMTGIVFGEAHA